ncbi:MAG TPA: GvpL/GvpF family gas vesicle protein [Candidatus Angelobacter sp.]|nr:GvpL/GvpF family gas vesicle protein [Candidatus Angelobacter sp.]
MSRALAYCAYLHRPDVSLPETGVRSAPVQVIAERELRLLWSEVEWPFDPAYLQKNAVEFHGVVQCVLKQVAVVPFRLLSVFSDLKELTDFAAEHAGTFAADLERLKDFVQMESVVYPAPGRAPSQMNSGAEYLRERALMLRLIEQYAADLKERLRPLARDLRVRQTKSGSRLFVLVERGSEREFRALLEHAPVPDRLSRRISGPWPAAEFLSDSVKTPQVAGAK